MKNVSFIFIEKPKELFGQSNTKVWAEFAVLSLSRVRLFAIPQTVAHQASRSMEFSRQKYWRILPFPTAISYSKGAEFRTSKESWCGYPETSNRS